MKKSFFLILFFAILIVIGIVIGEPSYILKKAVSICLSCIGIAS